MAITNDGQVRHVIKEGVEHGKYYRLYVTQVNNRGQESEHSAPALVRVGDVYPPPVPTLSIENTPYENGCYADGDKINVMIKWTDVSRDCDDLAYYIRYVWKEEPVFWPWHGRENGIYPANYTESATSSAMIPNNTTSETLSGNTPEKFVYIGIQAVDLTGNRSDIYVIKVMAEDTTTLMKPMAPLSAETYSTWAIRISLPCPVLLNIESVIFYRDGWKQLPPLVFYPGMVAEYVDHLNAIDGLTHFYTYRYITKDGRETPMSDRSATVTAIPIDETYLSKAVHDALEKAWQSEINDRIADVKKAAKLQMQKITELASRIDGAKIEIDRANKKITMLAENIELLAARVDRDESKITAMGTAITQNAEAISLRATKTELDNAKNEITKASTALIDVQAERVTALVSSMAGYDSSLTILENAIEQKVSYGDMTAQVALAIQNGISTASIEADEIVLKGRLLLLGDARIVGTVYSDNFGLVDAETGEVFWGTKDGTLIPTGAVTVGTPQKSPAGHGVYFTMLAFGKKKSNPSAYSKRYDPKGKGYIPTKIAQYNYTAKPRVNFNGYCKVKMTLRLKNVCVMWKGLLSKKLSYDQASFNGVNFAISCSIEGWNFVETPFNGPVPIITTGDFFYESGEKASKFYHPRMVLRDHKGELTSKIPYFPAQKMYQDTFANGFYGTVDMTWTGDLPIDEPVIFYVWMLETKDYIGAPIIFYDAKDYEVSWGAY